MSPYTVLQDGLLEILMVLSNSYFLKIVKNSQNWWFWLQKIIKIWRKFKDQNFKDHWYRQDCVTQFGEKGLKKAPLSFYYCLPISKLSWHVLLLWRDLFSLWMLLCIRWIPVNEIPEFRIPGKNLDKSLFRILSEMDW